MLCLQGVWIIKLDMGYFRWQAVYEIACCFSIMLYFKKIDIEICYQRNGCSVDLIIKGKNAGVGILWVSQKGVQFKKEK